MIMRFFSILCGKTDVHIEPFEIAVVFMYNEDEIIDSFYVYNDFNLQKRLTDFKILAFDFGIEDFGWKVPFEVELIPAPYWENYDEMAHYTIKPWNCNANRNNMQENPLLYMRLSLQVVYY